MRNRRAAIAVAGLASFVLLVAVVFAGGAQARDRGISSVYAAAHGTDSELAGWLGHAVSASEAAALRRVVPRSMAWDPGLYDASIESVGFSNGALTCTVRVVGIDLARVAGGEWSPEADVAASRSFIVTMSLAGPITWKLERIIESGPA